MQVEVTQAWASIRRIYESGGRGWVKMPTAEGEQALKPGEWNNLEVSVQGNHIVTQLNGVKIVDFTDDAPKFADGVIGLQIHTGGGVKMRWKDILDSGEVGTIVSCPHAELAFLRRIHDQTGSSSFLQTSTAHWRRAEPHWRCPAGCDADDDPRSNLRAMQSAPAMASNEGKKPLRLGLILGIGRDPNDAIAKVHDLGLPTCQAFVMRLIRAGRPPPSGARQIPD